MRLAGGNGQNTVNTEILKRIYMRAFRIRTVEEEIARRYPQGQMRCPVHLSIGQELVPAVLMEFICESDYAVSTHRAHAHYLAKGGDLNRMIAELYGKSTGCSRGMGGSMHLVDKSVGFLGSTAIVGGTSPVGVGLGLSIKINAEDKLSVVFIGDGATEEGVFYESLNFASLKALPVLFVCENNLYSVYSGLEVRQPATRKIYQLAKSIGINSSQVDGYCLEDTYQALKHAVEHVRKHDEPFFVETLTYRFREHCGPNFDNHIGYRKESEYEKYHAMDPLMNLRQLLQEHGLKTIDVEEKAIAGEIDNAFKFAQNSPVPDDADLDHFLFKEGM